MDRICLAKDDPSGRELRLVVKNLDRLSDLLCGVIDLCELVRNVHPDDQWITACERSYDRLCSYMNGLNTHVGLYEVSPRRVTGRIRLGSLADTNDRLW